MLRRFEDRFINKIADSKERQTSLSKLRRQYALFVVTSCFMVVLMFVALVFYFKSGAKGEFGIWPLFIIFLNIMVVGISIEFRIYLIRVVELLSSRKSEPINE